MVVDMVQNSIVPISFHVAVYAYKSNPMSRNIFNSIQLQRPNRNKFDLTHDVKLSCNMGDLVPICVMEAVPGDAFTIGCESLLRFAPLTAPVMHRMDVSMHYFFVPNRILWDQWEDYITGNNLEGPQGPAGDPTFPYVTITGPAGPVGPTIAQYNKLCDYLGIPNPDLDPSTPTNTAFEAFSAFPFAAYQSIWDNYYRDQNIIPGWGAGSGPMLVSGDNTGNFTLGNAPELGVFRKRAWEHDYFTSALPWAQKGAAVDIPLGAVILDPTSTTPGKFVTATGHIDDNWTGGLASSGAAGEVVLASGAPKPGVYDPQGSLITESTTINDLRRAFKLQEWLERNARGGTRYIEHILAHFGVKSSDKRLQRPEYITGTKSPVVISEILNTTGTNDLPQGNMAGHGVSVTSGKYGKYYCEEHGYIIGIMSIMPKTCYQQGTPRHFLKGVAGATPLGTLDNKYAFYWPEFANIGEQEVYDREIWDFDVTSGDTFGYVPRYAEYKFMPSRVCGDFRNSLDFWHLGRIFQTKPSLNQDFIECTPRLDIFPDLVTTDDHLYVHILNKVYASRLMPKYGTPQF